jgi:hypothetical protein
MTRVNKILLAAIVAASCGSAGLYAQSSISTGATPAHAALTMQVAELNVDGVALGRVLDYIRNSTGANLVVNWKVLEGANVNKDTPITLNVRELPMKKLLRLVLDQASPSLTLTWTVDSNVISITTADEADKVLITRVYVVDDLVMTDNQTTQPPSFNLQSITQNGSSGGSGGGSGSVAGGGQGIFTQSSTPTVDTQTTEQRGQDLAKLIESVIRPDIWRDNGGQCSIRYFSGKLVVTAPVSVHEMIGGSVAPEGGQRIGL